MKQRNRMVMWAKPQEASLDEMTEISYELLSVMKDYGNELSLLYFPAMKKADVASFELSKAGLRRLLEKNVNQEGERVFLELGRSLSFFTSLNDEKACSVRIQLGVTSTKFNNIVTIDFPFEKFSGYSSHKVEFELLFKQLIGIFCPYYAFVRNLNNDHIAKESWKDNKPTYVHWMNYYDRQTAEAIGIEKFKGVQGAQPLYNGYFQKIQETPIDVENPEHLHNQKLISTQLGLC